AGTDLRIVQEGIPAAIPVDFCYQGWQESLALLAQLVEPDIPDRPSAVLPPTDIPCRSTLPSSASPPPTRGAARRRACSSAWSTCRRRRGRPARYAARC